MNKILIAILGATLLVAANAAATQCTNAALADAAAAKNCKPAQCVDGTDTSKCLQCADGFGLTGGNAAGDTCTACATENCALCAANKATCTDCKANFGLVTAAGADQYKCKACDTKCATCETTDNTKCKTCADGYVNTGSGNTVTCEQCKVDNCKTCAAADKDTKCTGCKDGYGVDTADSKSCKACNTTDCATCGADYAKCLTCKNNKTVSTDGKTCSAFKTGAGLALGAVVSVALFSLLF